MCCCGHAMLEFEQTAQAAQRWLARFGITRDWMSTMKAKDVMTRNVISIAPDAAVFEALRLMLQHKISGLPVVDRAGGVVGIVTEGDFLRRAETGTERKRPRWLELIVGPGRLAEDYVRSHARRVDEVMTCNVETVTEDAQLGDIVALMERHRIKRVPVVRDGQVVGIVSRANLLRALASVAAEIPPGPHSDEAIHEGVLAELDRQSWGPRNSIDVSFETGSWSCGARSLIRAYVMQRVLRPKRCPASRQSRAISSGSSRCPPWHSATRTTSRARTRPPLRPVGNRSPP
jgi:CBS domain-containing protein